MRFNITQMKIIGDIRKVIRVLEEIIILRIYCQVVMLLKRIQIIKQPSINWLTDFQLMASLLLLLFGESQAQIELAFKYIILEANSIQLISLKYLMEFINIQVHGKLDIQMIVYILEVIYLFIFIKLLKILHRLHVLIKSNQREVLITIQYGLKLNQKQMILSQLDLMVMMVLLRYMYLDSIINLKQMVLREE